MLEREREQWLAMFTAALQAGKAGELPSWDEAQAELDADLAEEPNDNVTWLRELGIA